MKDVDSKYFCGYSCSAKWKAAEKISGRKKRDLHRFCAICFVKFSRPSTGQLQGSKVDPSFAACSNKCAAVVIRRLQPPSYFSEKRAKGVATFKASGKRRRGTPMTEENRVKLSARSNEWWLQNPEHRAVMAKEIRRRREENPEAFAEGLRMAGEAAPRGKDHRLYGIGMDARSALYRVYHRRTCTWMRSSWEIRVADALFDWGVPFRYEPRVFDTPYGGYKPDFYLSAHDAYLEVKGFNYDPSKLEWAKGDIPRYWVVWGVKGKGRDSPNIDALRAWLGTLAPCQKPEP